MAMKNKPLIKSKKVPQKNDDVQITKSRLKWNFEKTSMLIHFWENNIDNIEYPISNNIWAKIKLKADKKGPTK